MQRQILLSSALVLATLTGAFGAAPRPTNLECKLERKVILSGKVRERENITEKATIDWVGKKLTVGKVTGSYVVVGGGEFSMVGLPPRQKVTFNTSNGLLTMFESNEFGEGVMKTGKCAER